MQLPYINFHTHNITGQDNVLECISCDIPAHPFLVQHPFLQVGIHPWHITNKDEQLIQLNRYADFKNCMAIGEIGLDKIHGSEWGLQVQVFEEQVKIARLKKKPIILHCVKAIDETLAILAQYKFNFPVIFHGFQGSEQQAKQLVNKGYYLSFGHQLLHLKSKAARALKAIEPGSFFFETDDAQLNIEAIYVAAAAVLTMKIDDLKANVWKNFTSVFP